VFITIVAIKVFTAIIKKV